MHQRELSDVELVRLGVTTIRIVIASVPIVQLLLVNACLFSADVVAAVEGVDVVRKEKFLRRELDVNFRLFIISQPSSI